MPMLVLDERSSELVRSVCEMIVPGCARVGAEVYVDALLARTLARPEILVAVRERFPQGRRGGVG